MTSWSCLKAAKVVTITVTSLQKASVFWWCHYCATEAGEKQPCCQKYKHLHKCDKLSHYPCLWSHTADSLSPRLRTDCPLWFGLSMQPWYMLGLCGGLLVPPLTSWKDQPVERESCPTAGSLPDEEWSPLSSPPPLTSAATSLKAVRMPLKKALDLLYHPLFTNNVSWLPSGDKAFPQCVSPFCLCWYKYCWTLGGNYNLRVRF